MGAVSADIQSPYTFGVRCFNEKIRFSLTSSVQEIWALENRVKIGPDTLKFDLLLVKDQKIEMKSVSKSDKYLGNF